MPKGRNPQPPHFKKFTPIGLLAACIIGSGLLLTTTVQAEEECTINLKDNTHTCQNIVAIQQQSLENNQAVFKIDFNPALYTHTKAIFEIHYDLDQVPRGYTVNIGDSESNDGGGGDSGPFQSHDSEIDICSYDTQSPGGTDCDPEVKDPDNHALGITGDDRLGGARFGKQPLRILNNFVKQGDTVTLTVSNEHLEWASTSGTSGKLDSPYLYALAGQLPFDAWQGKLEGSVNYDIYAAFNRVIDTPGRSGTGVSWVKIKLVQEQKVVLYTTSAKDIRAVPLVRGSMPDLTKGVDLVASALCIKDNPSQLTQPAEIVPLSAGEFIAIWRNQIDWSDQSDWNDHANSCYSRFTPDDHGSFTETYMGQWFGGGNWDNGDKHNATGKSNLWTPIPKSADLNGDSIDDLVLIHGTGAGDAKSYQYKVAFGQEDGSFDFTGKIFGEATACKDDEIGKEACTCRIAKCVRGSYFNLEDADRDGYVDLVFHSFDGGGPFTTTLYMLKGQKEGSFAATPKELLTGLNGEGSTTPVFGNFKADDFLDVFLPPDDDVSDSGQAYIAFGKNPGLGTFDEVKESIDFDPSHEGGTSDKFSAEAGACDINLDGNLDIVSDENRWNVSRIAKVYSGNGQGGFPEDQQGTINFPKPEEEVVRVVLQAKNATDVRVVPLVPGNIPDFTNQGQDVVLEVPEGCEDDMTQPVTLAPLNQGQGEFIAVWWNFDNFDHNGNGIKACYSRYKLDSTNKLTLLAGEVSGIHWPVDEWNKASKQTWLPLPSYAQLPSTDLNGDNIDDLVLYMRGAYPGAHKYKVALGQSGGGFDFNGAPITLAEGKWTGDAILVNADGDQHPDLVYYTYSSGGRESTDLYMLKGQGDGTFSSSPIQLLSTGVGKGSVFHAFGDFTEDGLVDIFLGPDDDVDDLGQAYVALGTSLGTFGGITPSIDFEPNFESPPTSDQFFASVQLYDVNLDNHLDMISAERWNVNRDPGWSVTKTTRKVYFGNGSGQFSEPGVLLHEEKDKWSPELLWMSVPRPRPTLTLSCGPIKTQATCDVVAYVVHDGGLNDSLLLSVSNSNPNLQFTPIGTVHQGYDLEALALDPQTGELYASSGENSNKPGYLYKVQEKNVVELGQPGAFAGGLEGLSFNPSTNILWGWAQGTGLVKFDRIEPNPNASVVLSYKGEIQDLTWSPQGDILYAVENIPQGGKNKVVLWAYHPADGHVVAQCEKELEGWQEVEALQALPNGNLLFGLHNNKKLLTGTIDPNQGCQLGEIKEIPVPYDDIEGIALTACPLTM